MANKDKIRVVSPELLKLAEKLNKQFGRGTLMTADRVGHVVVPRWSTGVFLLDLRLGGGTLENGVFTAGLPAGRWSMMYGQKSSGKTTALLRAVGIAQRTCANCFRVHPYDSLVSGEVESIDPNTGRSRHTATKLIGKCECGNPRNAVVAWIDQENKWDGVWAKANRVFEERLVLARPQYAEEGCDVVEQLLYSGEVDIIVFDSIAAAVPAKEIENSSESWQQGLAARIFNKGVRKWNAAIIDRARSCNNGEYRVPTIWLVNQIRYKIGVMFGDPTTTPGGQGIGFANNVEIRTSGGSQSDYKIDKETGDTLSVNLRFGITKNQSAPSGGKGEYRISLADTETYRYGQVLDFDDVFAAAERAGIIEAVSARKYSYMGQEFAKSQITKMWAVNDAVYEETKQAVLAAFLSR